MAHEQLRIRITNVRPKAHLACSGRRSLVGDTNSIHRYRHIITGSKSPKADDMLGGIVADGMGLGKTLTMIASIVANLGRADEFTTDGGLFNIEGKTPLMPVKATLVIVPSACKLPSNTWSSIIGYSPGGFFSDSRWLD